MCLHTLSAVGAGDAAASSCKNFYAKLIRFRLGIFDLVWTKFGQKRLDLDWANLVRFGQN